MNKERTNTANKKQRLSACTEAYKEHIMYTFNAFCRVVIRYFMLQIKNVNLNVGNTVWQRIPVCGRRYAAQAGNEADT